MIQNKQLLFIFLPAIAVVGFAFFVRVIQYEPLYPKETANTNEPATFQVPIHPSDPILGDKKASVTVIAFEDFSCESCKAEQAILDELLRLYPKKLKVILKGVPASHFPFDTRMAHEYAYCANQQGKFNEFMHMAFVNSENLSPETVQTIATQIPLNDKKLTACLESGEAQQYVAYNEQIATALNVQAVPAMFIDNSQVNPPGTVEGWQELLGIQ